MIESFRIGIAGLGTVGASVVRLLQTHGPDIARRAGRAVEIVSVAAKDRTRDRGVDVSGYEWTTPEAMGADSTLDAVVELIGGEAGPAAALVEDSLKAGRCVVTANKALLAHHGLDLARLAENSGAALCYEGAVAGGIPIIRTIRQGLAGNEIRSVYGILNGTCNYILTQMRETGRAFDDILAEAQIRGYAEADPSFDIDGIDAAHKLTLLAALAFGMKPDFTQVRTQGIRRLTATDIVLAGELGYRIKLLGVARRLGAGVVQSVEPCLVPAGSPLGAVEGVYNAVFVEGDFVGKSVSIGRGAGAGPTASAVVSDIIDLAAGNRYPAFGISAESLKTAQRADAREIINSFYLRLNVLDRPGVLADVSAILRDHNVSIETLLQRGRDPEQPVPLVLTTHDVRQADMAGACGKISALGSVVEPPCLMRIETL